ncbi:MAG: ATP-binding protein [Deltaproteobacteria bacterium]|nr:ATP-binding protein [Deltaproteobacteria bacterium]
MLNKETENRLLLLNPWLTDSKSVDSILSRFLPPIYIERAIENLPALPDRAILIIGPRQSGKSTFVWRKLRPIMPNVLFINMEDPQLRMGCANVVEFAAYIRRHLPRLKAIFIDEIQHLEEGALLVKGLVDSRLGLPVWVTGSASFHLKSRTRESLAGRATRRQLLPFSHAEIFCWEKKQNAPVAFKQQGRKILHHQLVFGSYPAVYLSESDAGKKLLLSDLVEALILRDASDIFRIQRVDAFRKLLFLLAGQIGQLINLSELASICNINVGTVNSYIEILHESHIIKKITPFAGGKRLEITANTKVYFIDNGIYNQLIQNFDPAWETRPDKGQLLENWAFSEILKVLPFQSSLKFWRSKSGAEVDAVIEHAGKIIAVEIKASNMKSATFSRSLRSFIDAYHPAEVAVLNLGLESVEKMDKTPVRFLLPESFPRWLEGLFSPI